MILYSRLADRKTYVEFWGASTKHPDSINCYETDVENGKYIPNEFQGAECNIMQWLMYVASMKTWIFHAIDTIEDMMAIHNDWMAARKYW